MNAANVSSWYVHLAFETAEPNRPDQLGALAEVLRRKYSGTSGYLADHDTVMMTGGTIDVIAATPGAAVDMAEMIFREVAPACGISLTRLYEAVAGPAGVDPWGVKRIGPLSDRRID